MSDAFAHDNDFIKTTMTYSDVDPRGKINDSLLIRKKKKKETLFVMMQFTI